MNPPTKSRPLGTSAAPAGSPTRPGFFFAAAVVAIFGIHVDLDGLQHAPVRRSERRLPRRGHRARSAGAEHASRPPGRLQAADPWRAILLGPPLSVGRERSRWTASARGDARRYDRQQEGRGPRSRQGRASTMRARAKSRATSRPPGPAALASPGGQSPRRLKVPGTNYSSPGGRMRSRPGSAVTIPPATSDSPWRASTNSHIAACRLTEQSTSLTMPQCG